MDFLPDPPPDKADEEMEESDAPATAGVVLTPFIRPSCSTRLGDIGLALDMRRKASLPIEFDDEFSGFSTAFAVMLPMTCRSDDMEVDKVGRTLFALEGVGRGVRAFFCWLSLCLTSQVRVLERSASTSSTDCLEGERTFELDGISGFADGPVSTVSGTFVAGLVASKSHGSVLLFSLSLRALGDFSILTISLTTGGVVTSLSFFNSDVMGDMGLLASDISAIAVAAAIIFCSFSSLLGTVSIGA